MTPEPKADPSKLPCPASATHPWVAFAGLRAFLLAVTGLRWFKPFGDAIVLSALSVIAATALAALLTEVVWQKSYRRSSSGLNLAQRQPSLARSAVKYLGLLASLGFVGFLYWLFPEYHGSFYNRYYFLLLLVVPPWLLLALPYFYWVDSHMTSPHDGYWHLGKLAMLQWSVVDRRILWQHLLGWLIKGFFYPLMFTYMCNDLAKFLAYDTNQLTHFGAWFDLAYDFLYFIDAGMVSMGYLMSLRTMDSHLLSAEPTMLGWTVAIICYQPFWSLIGGQYLAYESSFKWGAWLASQPALYVAWGTLILLLTAVYVWATIIFGARFSNLTHRGIITNGPYRFTKHPAYLAKNLSWWMIAVPFISQGSGPEALRHCLLLLVLNGIYLVRAITEERHLSNDPAYVAYAQWIDAHGALRWLRIPAWLKSSAFKHPHRKRQE